LGRQDELNFLTGSLPNRQDDTYKHTEGFKIIGYLKTHHSPERLLARSPSHETGRSGGAEIKEWQRNFFERLLITQQQH
jgi:hypothetical protein